MATFNSPPGWPAPPAGWSPPAGWQPDPSWPPAPAGWSFWTETAEPAPTSPDDPYAWALAPASTATATAAAAPVTPVAPVPQFAGTLPLPVPQAVPQQHGPVGTPSPYAPVAAGFDLVAGQIRAAAKRAILFGCLWFVGGLAVTAFAYLGTAPGGRFPIFWGAVVFGAFQAIRGLVRYSRADSTALEQLSGQRL